MEFIAESEADTESFARLMSERLRAGDVLFLEGNLGAGKTSFARALIRALSRDDALEVPSPTFTLLQTYDTPAAPVWHYDLYRIKDPDEIWELGWEEALSGGIVVIEWPERLAGLAPRDRLGLVFSLSPDNPGQRVITLTPYGTWKDRL